MIETPSETPSEPMTIREVVLEVSIAAPRARVWDLLTTEIHEWWPRQSFCVGGEGARFTLEPRVGGRQFEDWGDGEGLSWGTVYALKRGEMLQITSDLFAEYGGPSRAHATYTLEEAGDGTLLRVRETRFGRISDATQAAMERGWTHLFGGCLKAHAEGTKPPAWEGNREEPGGA